MYVCMFSVDCKMAGPILKKFSSNLQISPASDLLKCGSGRLFSPGIEKHTLVPCEKSHGQMLVC